MSSDQNQGVAGAAFPAMAPGGIVLALCRLPMAVAFLGLWPVTAVSASFSQPFPLCICANSFSASVFFRDTCDMDNAG